MKRLAVAAALVAFATSVAIAGPIEDRQAIMKGVAAATKAGVGLAKGETPFDDAKAKQVMQAYVDAAAKMPALFPAGSETGDDTTASPKIWEDMAGFTAAFEKFGKDATAGLAATDQASFGKAMGDVTKNCASCHAAYRIKKG